MTDSPLAGIDDVFATAIHATKLATLVSLDPRQAFAPLFERPQGGRYGVDASARCDIHDHDAPYVSCQCGFHAVVDSADLDRLGTWHPGRVRLVVELSGMCVEHEQGWRAARQQVKAVEVPDRCARCGTTATCLSAVHGEFRASCRRCARQPVTVGEAADALGVPVRFAPCKSWAGTIVERAVRTVPYASVLVGVVAAVVAVVLSSAVFAVVGAVALGVSTLTGPFLVDVALAKRGLTGSESVRLNAVALPHFVFSQLGLGMLLLLAAQR